MALTVSTDLSVNTSPTQVEEKLQNKQKALRESIEKGEPKVFGVSKRRVMASIILKGSAQFYILNADGGSFHWSFHKLT